jgi:hypothetical protein
MLVTVKSAFFLPTRDKNLRGIDGSVDRKLWMFTERSSVTSLTNIKVNDVYRQR